MADERTFEIAVKETTEGSTPRNLRLTLSVEEVTEKAKAWRTLKVGAGGWCTGMDIHRDGMMVARTDTYGGYVWHDDEWHQLVSLNSIPTTATATGGYGGILELCIAPSDSSIFYMVWGDSLYRSGDHGKLWNKTGVSFKMQDANTGKRFYGQKMAVHPSDPGTVIVGTQGDGVFRVSGGGDAFIKVNVPDATDITGIVFSQDGKTVHLAAAEHGCYRSSDGGQTFESISGPINGDQAALDHNGDYLLSDLQALHRYKGGVWSALYTASGLHGVAVDPIRAGHIIVCNDGGSLGESLDNGETWGDGQNWATRFTSEGDIPWLGGKPGETGYMSAGRLLFDPNERNKLWMSAGVGVWHTTLPNDDFQWHQEIIWQSQSRGIEQLCANDICVMPGSEVALASWDRPVFWKDDNLDQYEEGYMPDSVFSMGWMLDQATSDPSFLCGLINYWGAANKFTGFTRDGKTWTPFPVQPPVNDAIGGSIAALTPDNIIVAPANRRPATYTKDGGKTWQPIALEGLPDWNAFHFAYYLKRKTVAADRVKPNTAYIYAVSETDGFAGLYETVDGGDTWTRIYREHIVPWDYYHATLRTMPGRAGELWFAAGPSSGDPSQAMMRSTDAGRTWAKVEGIFQPHFFNFGAEGEVVAAAFDADGKNWGIYHTTDSGETWQYLGLPLNRLDGIACVAADRDVPGRVYVGFNGSGFAYYG